VTVTIYVPGTEETDQKKQNISLQQLAAKLAPALSGQITGTTTNDSATAGNVGEYVESVVAAGSAVALVTGTAKTITSIALTAGDWDVSAVGYILPAATTSLTSFSISISGTTNTLDTTTGKFSSSAMNATVSGGVAFSGDIPSYRFSLSGATTVFLVAVAGFTVSTASACGIVRARRVR
jgi:hypothetical protein